MTIVAVVGDACTTTTVALASAWPASHEAMIVEADPSGGDRMTLRKSALNARIIRL